MFPHISFPHLCYLYIESAKPSGNRGHASKIEYFHNKEIRRNILFRSGNNIELKANENDDVLIKQISWSYNIIDTINIECKGSNLENLENIWPTYDFCPSKFTSHKSIPRFEMSNIRKDIIPGTFKGWTNKEFITGIFKLASNLNITWSIKMEDGGDVIQCDNGNAKVIFGKRTSSDCSFCKLVGNGFLFRQKEAKPWRHGDIITHDDIRFVPTE